MLYSLRGTVAGRGGGFVVVEVCGIGFRILTSRETTKAFPGKGSPVSLFCFLYVREDKLELYGFLDEGALGLFEMLNSVSGVGPKTALGVLDVDTLPNIMAAIIERRADFLTRTSGIGKKTAERIILELHNKINLSGTKTLTEQMDLDVEVEEALVGLGYARSEVKKTLSGLGKEEKTLEGRLKATLKALGKTKTS